MRPLDLDALGRRFNALQLRMAGLQGQATELLARKEQLAKDIALAKGRIELAPQVTEALTFLQEKAHARAVGEFEDLLSAFVEDVIPEAGAIRLELSTVRSAPALDILLDNKGKLEDILEGNGGGLTNVVVTALRYAALARTDNRAFIVLDEPDCWLKSHRVPPLVKVIGEVANPRTLEDGSEVPGCQTLMISHNDLVGLAPDAHILSLEEADGAPYVVSASGAKPWPDAAVEGVRWLEVENLRRHEKTRVDLSPGLNVLTGDVNGGKSTLFITTFRAMAYGESDDTMIRHDADQTVIRMGLEKEVVLEMVRNRKGAPKVLYRRYEAGVLTNEGRQETRGGVPSFISEALRVSRVDDLDIQLIHQKQPVFLLNEPPARRAQLLSVGKESGLLQALIEKQRLVLRRDRDQLKRDELEYNQVGRKLTALGPLKGLGALVDILRALHEEAVAAKTSLSLLKAALARLEPLAAKVKLATYASSMMGTSLAPPALTDTRALAAMAARLEHLGRLNTLPRPPEIPVLPTAHDTAALSRIGRVLVRGAAATRLAQALPIMPALPSVQDTSALSKAVLRVSQLADAQAKQQEAFKVASDAEKAGKDALHKIMDELGVCPLCDQAFAKEESHA